MLLLHDLNVCPTVSAVSFTFTLVFTQDHVETSLIIPEKCFLNLLACASTVITLGLERSYLLFSGKQEEDQREREREAGGEGDGCSKREIR